MAAAAGTESGGAETVLRLLFGDNWRQAADQRPQTGSGPDTALSGTASQLPASLNTGLSMDSGRGVNFLTIAADGNTTAATETLWNGQRADALTAAMIHANAAASGTGTEPAAAETAGDLIDDMAEELLSASRRQGKSGGLPADAAALMDAAVFSRRKNAAAPAAVTEGEKAARPPSETALLHGTTASRALRAADIMDQVMDRVRVTSFKSGTGEIRVNLYPPELGQVRMEVSSDQHLVNIRIMAEAPVVRELMEQNLGQLRADLQARGLEIGNVDVMLTNDPGASPKDAFAGNDAKSGAESTAAADGDMTALPDYPVGHSGYGNGEARAGRVDYFV
ncbi:hypothetical protein CSB20_04300 [bacterium DOLZORAL124_64_63]|nr:MAG: hypothetical protein CSB20_04300 [bacterium DOLZORAL124_64_63]